MTALMSIRSKYRIILLSLTSTQFQRIKGINTMGITNMKQKQA